MWSFIPDLANVLSILGLFLSAVYYYDYGKKSVFTNEVNMYIKQAIVLVMKFHDLNHGMPWNVLFVVFP